MLRKGEEGREGEGAGPFPPRKPTWNRRLKQQRLFESTRYYKEILPPLDTVFIYIYTYPAGKIKPPKYLLFWFRHFESSQGSHTDSWVPCGPVHAWHSGGIVNWGGHLPDTDILGGYRRPMGSPLSRMHRVNFFEISLLGVPIDDSLPFHPKPPTVPGVKEGKKSFKITKCRLLIHVRN